MAITSESLLFAPLKLISWMLHSCCCICKEITPSSWISKSLSDHIWGKMKYVTLMDFLFSFQLAIKVFIWTGIAHLLPQTKLKGWQRGNMFRKCSQLTSCTSSPINSQSCMTPKQGPLDPCTYYFTCWAETSVQRDNTSWISHRTRQISSRWSENI